MFDPARLALSGVLLSALLLFQPTLTARVAMLAAAAIAAWLSGRKLSPGTTILVMAGIVFANLLVPVGRKLLELGPLVITEMALRDGIRKAVSFEALMHISKACLGTELRLPGRFGAFLSEALMYYDRIIEYRGSIGLKTIMKNVDEILLRVYYDRGGNGTAAMQGVRIDRQARRRGDAVLATLITVAALPLVIQWVVL